jgi:ribosome recycling factor
VLDNIIKDTDDYMQTALEVDRVELGKLRTGRAHSGLVDSIKVAYYGNETPIKNVANITVSDARTIVITPWEQHMVKAIEKAVRDADLGLNPIGDVGLIRIPIPPLTEERRREMVKVVKSVAETSRIAIRNIRRDAMERLKELLKKKDLNEDEERRNQEVIQKITDGFIEQIDHLMQLKETELMKV